MIESAAASAGLQICSTDAFATKVPGASSAVLYRLSPGCDQMNSAEIVRVLVVGFSSANAENAAIAEARGAYYNWQATNTAAFMSGYNVIVVQGAPRNQAVTEVGASLIEQGAVRIF